MFLSAFVSLVLAVKTHFLFHFDTFRPVRYELD